MRSGQDTMLGLIYKSEVTCTLIPRFQASSNLSFHNSISLTITGSLT